MKTSQNKNITPWIVLHSAQITITNLPDSENESRNCVGPLLEITATRKQFLFHTSHICLKSGTNKKQKASIKFSPLCKETKH